MLKSIFFICLAICSTLPLTAQKALSWKQHAKLAEEEFDKGNYAEAGENFQAAWEAKPKKTELIFKAAESFYIINDYRAAAEAYQHVKDENDTYPLVGLKYARSLKQDAQYDRAKVAFRDFLDAYSGQGKSILEEIIRKEVMGCELAAKLPLNVNKEINLVHPGRSINSEENEFAPFATADALYFSSSKGGRARVYNSDHHVGRWTKANTPKNFPLINKEHYSNAVITPDGEKMFFTICSSEKTWDELKARCEIFVTNKTGRGWSKPRRLPDFINMRSVTATQPHVVHQGGQEILYFVSNRDGGRGGLDIWSTTRSLSDDNASFTLPVNLGPTINTIGDEVTPFYDTDEGVLYFSSNGQVSIGGFDVFKAKGEETAWTTPQNVGLPINSNANDYGFFQSKDMGKGFLVTNRIFGGSKISTRHTDILSFEMEGGAGNLILRGTVFDQSSGNKIHYFNIALIELARDGSEKVLIERDFSNGNYSLDLLEDRRFRVIINSDGYEETSYEFTTDESGRNIYGEPVFLEVESMPFAGEPSMMETTRGDTYTARGASPEDNSEYVTNSPRFNGTYYKIQLSAVRAFNQDTDPYQKVSYLGRFDTEKLMDRNLTRVLLADFFSKDEAFNVLKEARRLGFKNAFVVRYDDGIRFGKVNE